MHDTSNNRLRNDDVDGYAPLPVDPLLDAFILRQLSIYTAHYTARRTEFH